MSVLSALAYTGGPFPLAYHGLGDCFVILFFGLLAVCLTEYALMCSAEIFWTPSWGMGLGVGFIINNLLVVNNYRDFEEDGTNGKNTLVVLFGKKFGLFFYAIGFFGANRGLFTLLRTGKIHPAAGSTWHLGFTPARSSKRCQGLQ